MTDFDVIRYTLARFCQFLDERRFVRIGRYTDELQRQPSGEWLFARRRLDWLQ